LEIIPTKIKKDKLSIKYMTDLLCIIMGIIDIIAGILILLGFGNNILGIILGIAMIAKGMVSFI